MIKYIGSKRTLVPLIVDVISRLPGVERVCDAFTGTTRVAQGLKAAGFDVVANDLATYSEVLARTYVEADAREIDQLALRRLLDGLEALPPVDGYFTEMFCRQARYFQPHNGMRVDAMRAGIDELDVDPQLRAMLLTSVMLGADRVDSTTGLQMAYLKQWAKRSFNDIELRMPELLAGTGTALRHDANELPAHVRDADLWYLDPPYNQHSYYSNYHVWETLVRNDAPESYGIARKRIDCRETKSDYNSSRRSWDAFSALVRSIDAPYLVVSFSDEGYFDIADIAELLGERGEVVALPVDMPRYVGARIGIHDPSGRKVGRVSHLRNREFVFVAGERLPAFDDLLTAVAR